LFTAKTPFDRLTALIKVEGQRTLSLLFLFSFDPAEKRGTFRTQENKNNKPYGNITILFEY